MVRLCSLLIAVALLQHVKSLALFDKLAALANARRVSHVMLRTDEAALEYRTKGECYELLCGWKERIDDDAEMFRILSSERSECASRSRGGDLGFKTRAQLSAEFADVVFAEAAEGKVHGPVVTNEGLHLLYVHPQQQ